MSSTGRLSALGALSVALYAALALGSTWTARPTEVLGFVGILGSLFAVYGAASWIACRAGARPTSRVVPVILVFAASYRLVLVFAGLPAERFVGALTDDLSSSAVGYRPFLLYDNDVWRYLWDGHVAACGIHPYRFTPYEIEERVEDGQCPLDSPLWWDVFDRMSYRDHRTIYPPLAQYQFRLLHAVRPGSVLVHKLVLASLDLGTCLLLVWLLRRLGRPPQETILYAWNPLVIKEFAGSGHVDAVVVFLMVLTVHLVVTRRPRRALLALAAATASKLAPAVVVGLVVRRCPRRTWPWLAVGVAVLVAPLARHLDGLVGGLWTFARDWEFNAGAWRLVARAIDLASPGSGDAGARAALFVVALGAAVWWTIRDPGGDRELVRRVALILGTVVLLSAAVMPWYLVWPLPFFILSGWRSWIVLTAASVLSYLIYIDQTEHLWWVLVEYGAFGAAAALEIVRSRRRTGSDESPTARPSG